MGYRTHPHAFALRPHFRAVLTQQSVADIYATQNEILDVDGSHGCFFAYCTRTKSWHTCEDTYCTQWKEPTWSCPKRPT